jgi:hypothetical protein
MPVVIRFVSRQPAHPPFVQLNLDIALENARAEPRWFLLPDHLNGGAISGIDSVNVYKLGGQVVVGHFSGTQGFHALLLPAGAQITLRKFPLRVSSQHPEVISLEIVTAAEFTVDGEAAQAWFGMDALSALQADVSAEPLVSQREVKYTRHTPEYRKVPVQMVEDERITLEVNTTR